METQNVQADAGGHYSILLGSTKPDGLPSELFASEQARWIGVQIEQQEWNQNNLDSSPRPGTGTTAIPAITAMPAASASP